MSFAATRRYGDERIRGSWGAVRAHRPRGAEFVRVPGDPRGARQHEQERRGRADGKRRWTRKIRRRGYAGNRFVPHCKSAGELATACFLRTAHLKDRLQADGGHHPGGFSARGSICGSMKVRQEDVGRSCPVCEIRPGACRRDCLLCCAPVLKDDLSTGLRPCRHPCRDHDASGRQCRVAIPVSFRLTHELAETISWGRQPARPWPA